MTTSRLGSHADAVEQRRARVRSSRKYLWGVGLIVSIALAVIPPWIDTNLVYVQVGVVIGLIGTCVGLLIEQLVRTDQFAQQVRAQLTDSTDNTLSALRDVSVIASAPDAIRSLISRLIPDWVRIDSHGAAPVFREIRDARVNELLSDLANLANGAITLNIDGRHGVRGRSFDDVLHYRAVAMGIDFWNTPFGGHYLATQHAAIQAGTVIERIFVLDDHEWERAESVVRKHLAIGVRCWVLLRSWVPEAYEQHVVDQGIITYRSQGKLLMQPSATGNRQWANRERLSIMEAEIEAADYSISKILLPHARSVTEDVPWSVIGPSISAPQP